MPRAFLAVAGLALLASAVPLCALKAQNIHPTPAPGVRAVSLQGQIRLDGKLDEAVWQSAPAATDFRQNTPHEGQPATQRTEVRFAFDGHDLYVGARMFDDQGAAGVRTRLVRRDADPNSDCIEIIFDTYHDHIGRLFFQVNPSGAKFDANGLGGGGDPSWDPVWDVKTAIDSLGWTAEMRIPFDQLRYPRTGQEQTWGLQIWRQENRLNELSQWAFWGIQESGGPPRFGHLEGLVIEGSPGRGEVLPYVVGRSAHVPVTNPADPFQQASSTDGRVGGDARILLTSNLTLNATVNPDFGQVEVDPAVVNLSQFETFFEEKRPFFVEGAGYFSFGGLNCFFCSNVSSLSTFYTRRVGRSPQVPDAAYQQGAWADIPDNTTILGAGKLTGRTSSGWSIGVLDAVTANARATIQRPDSTYGNAIVEPAANYFVSRFAKDLRGGATQIRAIATSMIRDLGSDPYLKTRLSSHAESFGLGGDNYFHSRDYRLMTQIVWTQTSGDSTVMLTLQRREQRYFQRPDRGNGHNGFLTDAYDSSLTAMRGLGAYARFSRETGGLLWEVATNIRTPGFENNDIAFTQRADYAWMNANILRQWTKPSSWYRSLFFIVGGQQQYNFDGDLTDRQGQIFGSIQFLNYWNASAFWIHRPEVFDDRLSRGGPVLQRLATDFWSANLSTDSRKKLVLSGFGDIGCNTEQFCSWDLGTTAEIKPRSNISVSFGPSFSHGENAYQFVGSHADTTAVNFYGRRYTFAQVFQDQVSLDTRLNVTFTPTLTFELFLQPLVASGRYENWNEFNAPRTNQRSIYGQDVGTITRISGAPGADTLRIDPDGTGRAPFDVLDGSFTQRSLRGNAVLRWEYRPGSTLYFVWTRSSFSELTRGDIDMNQDMHAVFRQPGDNIFLVKVNYRIGL